MLSKRIIPCLDVKDGKTVKGINFENLREVGDSVEMGERYTEEGADELVFLDITATNEKRRTLAELVRRIARVISIPFTVGGGISSVKDVSVLLNNGADKIAVNTAALKRPELISELANNFGSQCVVLAVDVKKAVEVEGKAKGWLVYANGGRVRTNRRTMDWISEAVDRGAGEILLTSMDHDGTKNGFAIELTKLVSESVSVPVIASGGAGTMKHFEEVFKEGKADAALAASVFHYKEIEICKLKTFLHNKRMPVRIDK